MGNTRNSVVRFAPIRALRMMPNLGWNPLGRVSWLMRIWPRAISCALGSKEMGNVLNRCLVMNVGRGLGRVFLVRVFSLDINYADQ